MGAIREKRSFQDTWLIGIVSEAKWRVYYLELVFRKIVVEVFDA